MYIKKLICAVVCLVCFLNIFGIDCNALGLSAESAVCIDGDAGLVAFEKNAHKRMGMASTTKIMTSLVALENCDLEKSVAVSNHAIGVEGSSIYLKHGEKLTMKELLYALLLQSANDAATAIAYEIGGSIENFAQMMNDKANALGLKDTHFTNPHGLYDENHYTTAYELAIITKNALDNPTFKEIVSTKKTVIPLNNGEGKRVLVNHNKLLNSYDGCIGVKTGFTKRTGRCLVSAAEKNGTTMIAVTLNAPSDWNDHKIMLDYGFGKITTYHLAFPEQFSYKVAVVGGQEEYIYATNTGGLKYTCFCENANIKSELILQNFMFAPVYKGDIIGQVIFYNNNDEIGRIDLISQNEVQRKIIKKKLFGIF